MSRQKTSKEVLDHKELAIKKVENYIDGMINFGDKYNLGKADKFSFWLEDYIKFLEFEGSFRSTSLKKYKRGEIIKAHLGFNIGSEEGGLHYCIVIEKNNSINSPIINVIPLTSIKKDTDLDNLHVGCVNLGNELYNAVSSKASYIIRYITSQIEDFEEYNKSDNKDDNLIVEKIKQLNETLEYAERTRREFERMKSGSIALVKQITTISKIRIYDPKTSNDPLANIKISNDKLNMIDEEIKKHFTH